MGKKGVYLLVGGIGCFLLAMAVSNQGHIGKILLTIFQPAGMIALIFSTYYSGGALVGQYRKGNLLFSGDRKASTIALLACFAAALVLTTLVLARTTFPIR